MGQGCHRCPRVVVYEAVYMTVILVFSEPKQWDEPGDVAAADHVNGDEGWELPPAEEEAGEDEGVLRPGSGEPGHTWKEPSGF